MPRILIVDDRATNRQLLLTLLGLAGHETNEAANGLEALQQTRRQRPDLIITDMLMPVMSGYELVQHLHADAHLRDIPVIFYTATYSEPQALKLAMSAGVKTVLRKPCEPEQILATVNDALGLNRSAQVPAAAQQQVAAAAREARWVEDLLSGYLRELNAVKTGFNELIEQGQSPEQKVIMQVRQDALGMKFSKIIADLSLMAARLSTLMHAGLDLLQERDAAQIVRQCFDAACRVMSSAYAAIGVLDDKGNLRFLFTKGVEARTFQRDSGRELPVIVALMQQRQVIRIQAAPGQALDEFAPPHPVINNFLGLPIASADKVYGWMYFANRLGAEQFTEEDQRVAETLAIQLALLHENFVLYDLLQEHAVQLQLEISERRHVERQLLQLNESLEVRVADRTAELQMANKEMEAYSYSVSHDLRAPLRTILEYTRLLLKNLPASLPDENRVFLSYIDKAGLRATEIVEALLRLSQLGRQPVHRQNIDVMVMVSELVEALRLQERDRFIDVQIEPLPHCVADATMLKLVFVNLLSNAIKFTRLKPDTHITIGWRQDKRAYFVADNGAGFNQDHAEWLFSPFRRDHSETEFEGAGIGLSIVQRVIQRHGGNVWAQGQQGVGATFYFTLY